MPFEVTWMDLEIVIPSKVTSRKTSIIWHHLNVECKEMVQVNLFTKQKLSHERLLLNYKRYWYSWPPEEKSSIWGQRQGLMAQRFCVIQFY